jgi:hypothetical protein
MRIFISYGHDTNAELVELMKADLEKRGHDVWFDRNKIKFGDDWRRSITEGITNSHKFLAFLSKHSTRDPGVCLDEIGIAIGVKKGNIQTILVESEHEVKPPPGIRAIRTTQRLDMQHWKERRAAGGAEWANWYGEKLAEIVRVVESDDSRRFADEIATLEQSLKPSESDSRIYELLKQGLTGRKWLFEAIENWRSGDRPSRVFWLMGAPGVGKSAVAAHLAIHGREVIAVEFCNWQQPGHKNPEQIVRTLAFQIATRLPDYRKLLLTLPEIADLDHPDPKKRKNAAELFDYLLAGPLHHAIDGGRERYLIVIDALDEAGGDGRNPLVEMLARHAPSLPDWIGLVVTSRPESDVRAPLQGLNPFVLDTASDKNRADIREYLRHELAPQLQGRMDADRLVEQILEKSEGVFLYAERFCDDVRHKHLSLDRPEQFPQGLGGIFFQYFQRQFPDLEKFRKDVRPTLRAILAAREPLPVEILQRLFHWQDEELRDFTRSLGSLFPVTKEANGEVIKPYHKSLADWLGDEGKAGEHYVSVKEGHKTLGSLFQSEFEASDLCAPSYWARHAPLHVYHTKGSAAAFSLMDDVRFKELLRLETPRSQRASQRNNFDAFVSFSRRDNNRKRVSELVQWIRREFAAFAGRDLRVFFDEGEISGSEDWRQRTLDALRQSRLLIVGLTPSYLQSPVCEWEFTEYLKHEIAHGFNGIAPIYLAEVPGWNGKNFEKCFPDWMVELRKWQFFDLRAWFETRDDAATNKLIQNLVRQVEQTVLRAERSEQSLGNVDAHNPHFIGRTNNLRMLRENFVKPNHIGVVTAVNGIGGIGKSALAIEYAHAFADEYGGGCWMVRCGGKDDLRLTLAELSKSVGFEFTNEEKKNPELQFERVLIELRMRANSLAPNRCLLILDNIDRPSLLAPEQVARLKAGDWLQVLATTRLGENELHGSNRDRSFLHLGELPLDDSLALIEGYQPGGQFRSDAERNAAREITNLLGGFTLAVELSAIYLGQFALDVTCAEYLARLKREGAGALDAIAPRRIMSGISATLDLLSDLERTTLGIAATASDCRVSLRWLRTQVAERFPEVARDAAPGYPDPWRNVLRRLLSLRLFEPVGDVDSEGQKLEVRMHRLLQEFARKRFGHS